MASDDLESHIDDILDVLSEDSEGKISREDLERQLKKFLEYGVPVDQAKQTLIKKFGGGMSLPSTSSERKLISDLQPNESSVNLLCRVISVNPKEITVKGEKRSIFYGIFGDESGTIPFTAWKDLNITKGDVIELSNAYTREWQGNVQLNLGDRVNVKKSDEELPESSFEPKEAKVIDLRSGLGSVEVTARILDIIEREAEIDGEKKKVFSGVIGDETGKAQFTSWHDFKLKKGDVVEISGGYVKSWKGIPQLTFDDRAKVKKVDAEKLPKGKLETSKIPLHLLVEKRGALDVEVDGTVIEVRDGSGFIMRCPKCNRVLIDDECKEHGKVDGNPDLRVKLVIDDGTGSVNSIIGREITEKLFGKKLDECKKDKDLPSDINKTFFARRIKLRGNALGDDFGTTVIAKEASFVDIDVKGEVMRLSEGLEDLQ
jgi:replication factor A1